MPIYNSGLRPAPGLGMADLTYVAPALEVLPPAEEVGRLIFLFGLLTVRVHHHFLFHGVCLRTLLSFVKVYQPSLPGRHT